MAGSTTSKVEVLDAAVTHWPFMRPLARRREGFLRSLRDLGCWAAMVDDLGRVLYKGMKRDAREDDWIQEGEKGRMEVRSCRFADLVALLRFVFILPRLCDALVHSMRISNAGKALDGEAASRADVELCLKPYVRLSRVLMRHRLLHVAGARQYCCRQYARRTCAHQNQATLRVSISKATRIFMRALGSTAYARP